MKLIKIWVNVLTFVDGDIVISVLLIIMIIFNVKPNYFGDIHYKMLLLNVYYLIIIIKRFIGGLEV